MLSQQGNGNEETFPIHSCRSGPDELQRHRRGRAENLMLGLSAARVATLDLRVNQQHDRDAASRNRINESHAPIASAGLGADYTTNGYRDSNGGTRTSPAALQLTQTLFDMSSGAPDAAGKRPVFRTVTLSD